MDGRPLRDNAVVRHERQRLRFSARGSVSPGGMMSGISSPSATRSLPLVIRRMHSRSRSGTLDTAAFGPLMQAMNLQGGQPRLMPLFFYMRLYVSHALQRRSIHPHTMLRDATGPIGWQRALAFALGSLNPGQSPAAGQLMMLPLGGAVIATTAVTDSIASTGLAIDTPARRSSLGQSHDEEESSPAKMPPSLFHETTQPTPSSAPSIPTPLDGMPMPRAKAMRGESKSSTSGIGHSATASRGRGSQAARGRDRRASPTRRRTRSPRRLSPPAASTAARLFLSSTREQGIASFAAPAPRVEGASYDSTEEVRNVLQNAALWIILQTRVR